MRRLVASAFVTLDGVMQAPGGPREDPTGGFAHGGWSVGYWDAVMGEAKTEAFSQPFEPVLGRRTYEIFAAHWPSVGRDEREERGGTASDVDDPVGATLNAARKHVASRTLEALGWANSTLLDGGAAEAVAKLKTADGPDLLVNGSSDLVQTLLDHDLVDELRVWTFPVVVGPGKRLFGSGTRPGGFELVEAKTSTTGVVMATYRRAVEIRGEEPTAEEVERRRRPAAGDH